MRGMGNYEFGNMVFIETDPFKKVGKSCDGKQRSGVENRAWKRSCLAFLMFFLFVCACGDRENGNNARVAGNENTLNFDVSTPFSTLNPYEAKESGGSAFVSPLLYSYLAVPDADGVLQGDLAESWSYDPKQFLWTIRLKKNVRYHDGTPLTSEDVACCIESSMNPSIEVLSENMEYVEAVSPFVIEVKLIKDDPEFLKKFWDSEIIQPPGRTQIDYYSAPVGSGAFKFGHREGDRRVCIVSNPEYYDTPPSIGQVCFHYEPNPEKTWGRLLTGRTDAAMDLAPENLRIMTKYGDRFHFNRYTLSHFTLILYNTKIDLFSTPKVRKALTLVIDRNYIVEKILEGYGRVATGPLGVTSPFYDPDAAPEAEYNPEKALALLKEEGWHLDDKGRLIRGKNRPFEFTLLSAKENDLDWEVAQYVQLALNDVGIQVRLKALPTLSLCKRYLRNTDFQAVLAQVAGLYRNPELLKRFWVSATNRCSLLGCFKDDSITEAVELFLNETNIEDKKRGAKIQIAFREIDPATFMYHKSSLDIMSKRIDCPPPFFFDYEGVWRLRFASIIK